MPLHAAVPSPKALILLLALVGVVSTGLVVAPKQKSSAPATSSTSLASAPSLMSASIDPALIEDAGMQAPEMLVLDEPTGQVVEFTAPRSPNAAKAASRAAALAALWPPGMESRAVASRAKKSRKSSAVSEEGSAYRGSTNEEQLILEAHERLQRDEPAKALELLAEHQRRYPDSAMTQSREAVRVVATCNLGKKDEARQLLAKFVSEWPESAFRQRIRGACGWSER